MNPLAARLAKGEPSAFAELYDACAPQLYRYLLARLQQPHAAADVLQETFLRLVRAGKKLRHIDDLESYAFRVAHNESQRWFAKQQRDQLRTLEQVGIEVVDTTTESTLESTEEVQQLLARINGTAREIVELKFFGGLTLAAIAVTLDLPPGTVATHYRRALQKIRSGQEQQSL